MAANDGDLLRADAFLHPLFFNQITNLPPKGTTHSFWDYYTRTQSVTRVVVLNEVIKEFDPAAFQYATVSARIEFKDGQSREDVVLLNHTPKSWQITLIKNPSE